MAEVEDEAVELENNFKQIADADGDEEEDAMSSAASSYKGEYGGVGSPAGQPQPQPSSSSQFINPLLHPGKIQEEDEQDVKRQPPAGELLIRKLKLNDFGPNFQDEVIMNSSFKAKHSGGSGANSPTGSALKQISPSSVNEMDNDGDSPRKSIRWSDLNHDENEKLRKSQIQTAEKFKNLDTDLFAVLPDDPPKIDEHGLSVAVEQQVTEEDLEHLMDDFLVEEENLDSMKFGGNVAVGGSGGVVVDDAKLSSPEIGADFDPLLEGVDFPKLKTSIIKEYVPDETLESVLILQNPNPKTKNAPAVLALPSVPTKEESLYASLEGDQGPSSPGMQMVMAALTFQAERKSDDGLSPQSPECAEADTRDFSHSPYSFGQGQEHASPPKPIVLEEDETGGTISDDSADENEANKPLRAPAPATPMNRHSPTASTAKPQTPSASTPKQTPSSAPRRSLDMVLNPISPKPKVMGAERVTPASKSIEPKKDDAKLDEFKLDAAAAAAPPPPPLPSATTTAPQAKPSSPQPVTSVKAPETAAAIRPEEKVQNISTPIQPAATTASPLQRIILETIESGSSGKQADQPFKISVEHVASTHDHHHLAPDEEKPARKSSSEIYTFDVPAPAPPARNPPRDSDNSITVVSVLESQRTVSVYPSQFIPEDHSQKSSGVWNEKGDFISVPQDERGGLVTSADLIAISIPDEELNRPAPIQSNPQPFAQQPPHPISAASSSVKSVQSQPDFVDVRLSEVAPPTKKGIQDTHPAKAQVQVELQPVVKSNNDDGVRRQKEVVTYVSDEKQPQSTSHSSPRLQSFRKSSGHVDLNASGYVVRDENSLRHPSVDRTPQKRSFLESCFPCLFPSAQEHKTPLLRG
eukprot:TRINITY_DN11113_c0_g1_i2.p1 TRINITY_DN11113_c0_g1~~TRINITY_DN11113_c0_g1_i2.p1  ORF type:complete len:879 (-),score=248.52 TRINITY_DN11113_c0_g1_i2:1653-4247(-)